MPLGEREGLCSVYEYTLHDGCNGIITPSKLFLIYICFSVVVCCFVLRLFVLRGTVKMIDGLKCNKLYNVI